MTPVRVATSRPAIKAYISTLLFLFASIILIAISTTAYALFYYNLIPQIDLEKPLYLQYGDGQYPHATTALERSTLISQQAYDITLELHLPRTSNNLAAGNFMVDMSLISPPDTNVLSSIDKANTSFCLAHSRRPAMLPYRSPLLSTANTLISLPWHTLGIRDLDADILTVPMFEHTSFARGWRSIPTAIQLELQSDYAVQAYSAKILFRARFEGIRYIIYNYRVVSFLVFTGCFYAVSLISTGIAWLVINSLLSTSRKDENVKQEKESRQVKLEGVEGHRGSNGHASESAPRAMPIKSESDSSNESPLSTSNRSESSTTLPTLGRQMPLRFPVLRSPESSVGSGGSSRHNRRDPPEDEKVHREIAGEPSAEANAAADDESDDNQTSRRRDRDSGIGTSMEESTRDSPGLQRRRSKPSSGSGGRR